VKGWSAIADQAVEEAQKRGRAVIPFSSHWTDEMLEGVVVEGATQGLRVLGAKGIKRFLWDCRGLVGVVEQELGLAIERDEIWFVVRLVRVRMRVQETSHG